MATYQEPKGVKSPVALPPNLYQKPALILTQRQKPVLELTPKPAPRLVPGYYVGTSRANPNQPNTA